MTSTELEVETGDLDASRWPIRTLIWLALGALATFTFAKTHSPLLPLPGIATILLIPGASIMGFLRVRPAQIAGRFALAVCLSLLVIMAVGGIASVLGPHLGIARPLDSSPQRYIWIALTVIVLAASAIFRRDPADSILSGITTSMIAVFLASGALVVLSILGVARLNHIGNNRLAIISTIIDVAVLLVFMVGGWQRSSRWPLASVLYSASLALVVSITLRGAHLYGSDIQHEYGVAGRTILAGVWVVPTNHDPYASMLSLTVLPAILHAMFRLHLTAFFELVVPSILAFLPVIVFSTARSRPRWINQARFNPRQGVAFGVVICLIVCSLVFPGELPSITRQAMATVIIAAIVMVMLDGAVSKRKAQIIISLLITTLSFTHYTSSYLIVGSLAVAWISGLVWSRGWIGVRRSDISRHRLDGYHKRVVNFVLLGVAIVTAFGWNIAITHNTALASPASGLRTSGLSLASGTETKVVSAPALEKILVNQIHHIYPWLVPVQDSDSIKLSTTAAPASPGVVPSLASWWNRVNLIGREGVWVLCGLALVYGVFILGRRRFNSFTSELVGLSVAGLVLGFVLRFSTTLATFYGPERGAIITAIFLAPAVTLLLDDVASRFVRTSAVAGVFAVSVFWVWITGLGALFFGGTASAALVANGENVERFVVNTQEVATANWLNRNLPPGHLIQTDNVGLLVLLAEVHTFDIIPEIVPPGVDRGAWIYFSTANLIDHRSRFTSINGSELAIYRSNTSFFNRNFNIGYSTGATRVYF